MCYMIPHVDPLSVNVFIWVLRMLLGRVSYFSDLKNKTTLHNIQYIMYSTVLYCTVAYRVQREKYNV